MSAQIFISYRRSDAAGHAGRLHDRLAHWFDADALFYDTAAILPGQAFPQRLADAIAAAKVVLVVIGPDWVEEINRRAGLPETDHVRSEVAQALRLRARPGGPAVIPVLCAGAAAPAIGDLHPSLHEDIAGLCEVHMHAFQGSDADWESQFVRLRGLIAAVPGVPAPRFRVPAGAHRPFRVIGHGLSRHFSDPQDKLAQLGQALGDPAAAGAAPAAAIHGMGGVGKTQLALRYSHEHRDRYTAVWWLRAENEDSLQRDALDGCRAAGAPITEGEPPAAALKRWLEDVGLGQAWLLVFDNAEDPAALRRWLPQRGGHHVVITSRNPAWSGIAQPVAMAVWTPEQGADFLARRLPDAHPSKGERAALAELSRALGGLPLALEQAGGYLDETASTAAMYLDLLRNQDAAPLLLDAGRALSGDEGSVVATLSIAFARLDGAAAQLLRMLAFCAPEPVPERLFAGQVDALPQPLADAARDPLQWHKTVAALRAFGLAERTLMPLLDGQPEPALLLHRLTQEAARCRHVSARSRAADTMLALIAFALPHDAASPDRWQLYARLAPHALNIERLGVDVDRRRLVWVLDRVATYLAAGPASYGESRRLFERALAINREDLGDADPNTLTSMSNLAGTLRDQGDLPAARALLEQVLPARRRVRGDMHPETLSTMHNLAGILHEQGDLPAARVLLEQVLDAQRRVLGDAHRETLASMGNLAGILHTQGELSAARTLYEQVLDTRRRMLGPTHPDTLAALNSLAALLHEQGDFAAARGMHEQVLAGLRSVLGDSHPMTLRAMGNLAATLRRQGEASAARALEDTMVAEQRQVLGDSHPDTLQSMRNLSFVLWQEGQAADAIEWLQRTVSAGSTSLGAAHPWVQRLTETLAQMRTHHLHNTHHHSARVER